MLHVIRRTLQKKWEQVGMLLFTTGVLIFQPESVTLQVLAIPFSLWLLYDVASYFLLLSREQRVKHLPILIAAGVGDDEFISMSREVWKTMEEWDFELSRYEEAYGIDRLWLSVHRDSDLPQIPDRWLALAQKFGDRLLRLDRDVEGQKVLHLFLNCPTALALGIGAVAGTRYEIVLHQRPQGGGKYLTLVNTWQRREASGSGVEEIRQDVSEPFRYIRVIEPEQLTPRLYVSLQLGKYPLGDEVRALAERKGVGCGQIVNKYDGRLETDDDWLLVAREVRTVLLRWLRQPKVEEVELFLGGTLTIHFLVGMALGNFLPISVNQMFFEQDTTAIEPEKTYNAVLRLDQLKRLG